MRVESRATGQRSVRMPVTSLARADLLPGETAGFLDIEPYTPQAHPSSADTIHRKIVRVPTEELRNAFPKVFIGDRIQSALTQLPE